MEQSESGNQKADYEEMRMQCEAVFPPFGVYIEDAFCISSFLWHR